MKFLNLKKKDRQILSEFYLNQKKNCLMSLFPYWHNQTRIYNYLMPNGNDMEIHVVAIKSKKDRPVIKEIVRMSVDKDYLKLKDVAFSHLGGYSVDWSPEKVGRAQYWSYGGKWSHEKYNPRRDQWKMVWKEVVNPEVLFDHPRFKYCAWTYKCGGILDYLKEYVKKPKIELLSKMDMGRFALKRGFVDQLLKSKEMLRFFLNKREDIISGNYGCDVIRLAYRKRILLKDAQQRIMNHRELKTCGLPDGVDSRKAKSYVQGKCSVSEYCFYLQKCIEVGLDLADTKIAFPKDFEARYKIVTDRAQELVRRRNKEIAKAQDMRICGLAKKYQHFEIRKNGFMLMIPRKTSEFIREGKRLDNCLGYGNYAAEMARGEILVAFVRQTRSPGKAFVAVEYDFSQKLVTQCYAAKNQPPPEKVKKFVESVFGKAA